MAIPKQVRIVGGRRYAFNGWVGTKAEAIRYRKHRVKNPKDLRIYKGRSSTGKKGYLMYVLTP